MVFGSGLMGGGGEAVGGLAGTGIGGEVGCSCGVMAFLLSPGPHRLERRSLEGPWTP